MPFMTSSQEIEWAL